MNEHISFPSIAQFKNVIQQVRQQAKYHNVPVPTIKFQGTVKLHGTNAGICRKANGSVEDIYFQSRERVITPLDDNAGFASWGYANRELLNDIFQAIENAVPCSVGETVQIYGEWAGGNIQKSVGLNNLPKKFYVFGIRASVNSESQEWLGSNLVQQIILDHCERISDIFCITEFPTWEVDIDMDLPTLVQNHLIDLTIAVESDCPVARKLLGSNCSEELIGEGIVWTAIPDLSIGFDVSGLRFKVKGEKHVGKKEWISGIILDSKNEQELINWLTDQKHSEFFFEFVD